MFYLVTVQQNKPDQIILDMLERGLVGEVRPSFSLCSAVIGPNTPGSAQITLKRRAGGEHLQIIRFARAVVAEP